MKAPLGALASAILAAIASFSSGLGRAESAPPVTVAPPAPSAESAAPLAPSGFRLAVISDLNSSYGSTEYLQDVHSAVAALTERLRPALVLITGDMVAGQKSGVDAPAMWRAFHSVVTDPLQQANIVVAPTPGNHDASPFYHAERAEYVEQWSDRRGALALIDGTHYPLRYSFTFGGAFFLSLDAASVGALSDEQRAWVESQLVAATPFAVKIAFGHLPLYPVARGREREFITDRKLEDLFDEHGVQVYASGHQHAYFPGATPHMRHLAMPCLGAGSRALIGSTRPSPRALAIVEVTQDGISSIDAFLAPTFSEPVARSSLPRQVAFGSRRLWRDDLVPGQLELATERSALSAQRLRVSSSHR